MIRLSDSSWGKEELDAIKECLDKDELTMGTRVKQFESDFATYLGSKYAVMVNSGSSANLLAATVTSYIEKPTYPKNIVLVPALSWSTTYYPWIQNGYRLKFVDINIDNFNVDLDKLESSIDNNCVGICVPHILGGDAGIEKILALAELHNLWVIEDTCESLGSVSQHKKKLGSLGLFGTFSFFRSHHISTMEGGMVTTNNLDHYHLLKSTRAHGWARDIPSGSILGNSEGDPWADKFKFYIQGYNLRPLEIEGAIGLVQLKKLNTFIDQRRSNAKVLRKLLAENQNFHLQVQQDFGSWMAFAILIKNQKIMRKDVIQILEDNKFETRPIVTGNFLLQPVIQNIKDYCIIDQSYKNAEYVDSQGFMIANHGKDLLKELTLLARILNSINA